MRLLHGEEEIRWHRPLLAGTELHVTPRVQSIEDKGSGELVVITTQIADPAGQPLCDTASSLFIRGDSRNRGMARERPDAAEHTECYRMDWTVASDQSERYAEVSGDRNPIHLDDEVGRKAGLKGRVLHGLCTMAFAQRAIIERCLDGDATRLRALRVRFSRPVYMQDTLSWQAWNAPGQADECVIGFQVRNDSGQLVIQNGIARGQAHGPLGR